MDWPEFIRLSMAMAGSTGDGTLAVMLREMIVKRFFSLESILIYR